MSGTQERPRFEYARNANLPILTGRKTLTQEMVRALFDYVDGKLIRRVRTCQQGYVGAVAGSLSCHGYLKTQIGVKSYLNHRLFWLWHYGYFPEYGLDHIDRDKTNNRIENLREVTQKCNTRNTGNRKNNTSKVKGVGFSKAKGTWYASIRVDNRGCHLGYHSDILEAACHRLAAEQSVGWAGCDSSSPAFQYVKENVNSKQGCFKK